MALEIERKFLLAGDEWRSLSSGCDYLRQGYLCTDKERTVRIRIAGDKAFLTIKGAATGASRLEFEYSLPLEDAKNILEQLAEKPLVEKFRHGIPYQGLLWEVDEFLGSNEGLILAEVELEDERQTFEKPAWIGEEVTADSRYHNACLVKHPYRGWGKP